MSYVQPQVLLVAILQDFQVVYSAAFAFLFPLVELGELSGILSCVFPLLLLLLLLL